MLEINDEKTVDTNFRYAIIAGWLIVPSTELIFSFIGIVDSLLSSNPFLSAGTDQWIYILSYIVSWLYIPFFILIIISWFKRKKYLPKLMVIYYLSGVLLAVTFIVYNGHLGLEWISMLIYSVLIGYFSKSRRVKETFMC